MSGASGTPSGDARGATRPANRSFFASSALEVAPHLLGALLDHETPDGTVTVRLTEVEAYLGDGTDPGSHAHRGKTNRNATMFGEPGHLYAYFTYGMHTCANMACSPEGTATGVLLRAGEVVQGAELARRRRGARIPDARLARGPANLVVSLGILLSQNGADLFAPPFAVRLRTEPLPYSVGPRTGLAGVAGGEAYPWRFWLPGEPSVSPYKRHTTKKRS